jgi:hypothetical protein
MAHGYKTSEAAANAKCVAFTTRMANGYRRIYSGTIPASVATALTSQVLLAELRFGATAFGSPTAGVCNANAMTGEDAALASGTPTFYRDFHSDGTTVEAQGTVGPSGGEGYDWELAGGVSAIVEGAPVGNTAIVHTEPLE